MQTAFYIIQIILSAALITFILLQAHSAGLGGIFGGDSGVYRTRRGVERTLFNATIVLSIAFFLAAIANVLIAR